MIVRHLDFSAGGLSTKCARVLGKAGPSLCQALYLWKLLTVGYGPLGSARMLCDSGVTWKNKKLLPKSSLSVLSEHISSSVLFYAIWIISLLVEWSTCTPLQQLHNAMPKLFAHLFSLKQWEPLREAPRCLAGSDWALCREKDSTRTQNRRQYVLTSDRVAIHTWLELYKKKKNPVLYKLCTMPDWKWQLLISHSFISYKWHNSRV